jgi:hypothetical protein
MATPLLVSFAVLTQFLLLNVVVAVMIAAFDKSFKESKMAVHATDLKEFQRLWANYDPRGSGMVPVGNFELLIARLNHPLSLKGVQVFSFWQLTVRINCMNEC